VVGFTANLARTTGASTSVTQKAQISGPGEHREKIQPTASTQWRATLVAAQRCIDNYRFGDAISLFQMFRAANRETSESSIIERLIRRTENLADKHSQIQLARTARLVHRGETKAGILIYKRIADHWGLDPYVSEVEGRLKALGGN